MDVFMIKKRLEFETVIDEEKNGNIHAPNDEDIIELIEIAKQNLDCQVIIHWYTKYSGWYNRRIYPNDTIETVKERMPKVYGL